MAVTQRRLFSAIAACARDEVWRADGCRDMAQWLAGRLGISNWAARRWVAAADALERLPRISDALADGVLSVDKVVELTRFATPDTEKDLVAWAAGSRPRPCAGARMLPRAPTLPTCATPTGRAICGAGGTRTVCATASRVAFRPIRASSSRTS
jgi:Domain of unknown function (DUF222)